jgi:hypothetical protein
MRVCVCVCVRVFVRKYESECEGECDTYFVPRLNPSHFLPRLGNHTN